MKKNYINLQEINFKNVGLNELIFNEMEMIDGGKWCEFVLGCAAILASALVTGGASVALIAADSAMANHGISCENPKH